MSSSFLERAMAKKQAQAKANADKPRVEPTMYSAPPPAKMRDRDTDMEILELLLNCDITPWEKTFCGDVLRKMRAYTHMKLSPKQGAIVDKLDKEYLERIDNSDPTPKGNPPAQLYGKSHSDRVRDQANPRNAGFDDMDDDIPF